MLQIMELVNIQIIISKSNTKKNVIKSKYLTKFEFFGIITLGKSLCAKIV